MFERPAEVMQAKACELREREKAYLFSEPSFDVIYDSPFLPAGEAPAISREFVNSFVPCAR